ncbi:chloride channel protein [Acetobacter aceti NRIC 0242]|uniref:Chloride channel protein n=1 Tax=Acetobacter aceti NBRC 14818 TaxID=887700 RepID=A0AB33IBB2_ACEAC|nr:chloride channel protein [Acetobacter aceti]TCS24460.1 H+/Cl- antiporter ClcA [Acetobacter aceti NBRC 14818]BCK74672.1 chloride channel protein [Acetobacter aceti NBRC 14818]GAN58799.1 chloride channel protein [Acetobacter aceti NBRC 14818]GBO82104.1 chloride channel protein [Acetobacter aceti NRIC 0242]
MSLYWIGAVLVGLTAVLFARFGDQCAELRTRFVTWHPWAMLVLAPAGFAFITWMTRTLFKGSQGSGIPQTIATLHMGNYDVVDRILTLRIAAGKIILTCLGLVCGASIGREGPSVQIGASIMHGFSRLLGQSNIASKRSMILAGGAAGMAAAFNTPLAGIVFAIEELSHSFEQKASGRTLTIVVISGVTAITLMGNYTYFGHADVNIPVGTAWIAVLVCGIVGGLAGGSFAALVIRASRGLPGSVGRLAKQRPIMFSALCGLLTAVIGLISKGNTYGTGYVQAQAIFAGTDHYPASFFILKYLSMLVSYCSGIPGGMFAPSLAIGAGIGGWIEQFLPHTTPGAVVLLGTVAYFCGVAQSPLTATIIVMEICDNQQVTLALLATAFLAFGVSRIVCPQPLYTALADRFLETMDKPSARPEPMLTKQDSASEEKLPI